MKNLLKKLRFSKPVQPASSGPTVPPNSSPNAPPHTASSGKKTKSLADLEKEMEAEAAAEAERLKAQQRQQNRSLRKASHLPRYVLTASLAVGVPIGFLWLVNLPYPPIREPIADDAPLLLLPSYIRFDNQYKAAINQVEQAKQFIDQPTSLADLRRGEEKLEAANKNLNKLPIWIESEWQDVAGANSWYVFAYSPVGFNIARSEVARLQAKVVQEKDAETALTEVEKRIAAAKQQYAIAQNLLTQNQASAQWESAIAQLAQIPPETLAGRLAIQKLEAAQNDFTAVVGQASSPESQVKIAAAAEYAKRAAQASQNPPHSVEEWQRVESLWQGAIAELSKITIEDQAGYQQAQKKLAEYRDYLEQIQVRRQQEGDSVRAMQQAEALTDNLVRYAPSDRQAIAADLNEIIRKLDQVQTGTTAHERAQTLRQQAQQKLNKILPKRQ